MHKDEEEVTIHEPKPCQHIHEIAIRVVRQRLSSTNKEDGGPDREGSAVL